MAHIYLSIALHITDRSANLSRQGLSIDREGVAVKVNPERLMGPGRGPYPLSSFVDVGGLVSFNPNIEDIWRRAGIYGGNPSATSTQYFLHALRSPNGTDRRF